MLYILLYNMSFFIFLGLEGGHVGDRFDLFLYLPVNRMFVTKGTEFSQFQSTRRIMSILLSNISGNARWFFINTVSNTAGTFQNNRYSDIFTLRHEPPLGFWLTQFFYFPIRREAKERKKKIEVANSKSNYERFRSNQSI